MSFYQSRSFKTRWVSLLWVLLTLSWVMMEIKPEWETAIFLISSSLLVTSCFVFRKKSLVIFAIFYGFYWLDSLPGFLEPLQMIPVINSLLPLVQTLIAVALIPGWKFLSSIFKKGELGPNSMRWFSLLIILFSASCLILWAKWTGDAEVAVGVVRFFSHVPRSFLLPSIFSFALLNAAVEEVTYRGLFYELMIRTFVRPLWPILLSSLCFASIHYQEGFPRGWLGFGMVFGYGICLGYMRRRCQGLLLPFLTHVMADLVIFGYIYTLVKP